MQYANSSNVFWRTNRPPANFLLRVIVSTFAFLVIGGGDATDLEETFADVR